jgi:DNA polymerase-3 subunit alpha
MEKFAEYGFNKSHSAAYALVAYQTAWLKQHHAAAFMAATLSSELADTDKLQLFHQDCLANDLGFLPPDINESGFRFRPVDRKTIRYALGAIKGTGESALGAILKARDEGGPFADLFDFCRRVDKRVVNRRVIEALVRAGCFDALNPDRARLLASVGVAMEAAEQAQQNAHQGGLFDLPGGAAHQPELVMAAPWPERERLLNEKQAIGFFLSGHPYNEVRAELSAFVRKPLAALEPAKEPCVIAGVVGAVRTQMTRRGKMAVILLDDGSAQVEISVFNELFEAERGKIREDDVLVVEGKVSRDDFTGGLRVTADRLLTLAEARGRFARLLKLSLNGEVKQAGGGRAAAQKLRALLQPFRDGPVPVRVRYRNEVAECELPLGDAWRVRLDDQLLAGLREWLSQGNVEVLYS